MMKSVCDITIEGRTMGLPPFSSSLGIAAERTATKAGNVKFVLELGSRLSMKMNVELMKAKRNSGVEGAWVWGDPLS